MRRTLVSCVLISIGASGCARSVQVWPPPLTVDAPITLSLAPHRSVVFDGLNGRDSVQDVGELQGVVTSLHGDTLKLLVTRAPMGTDGSRILGRFATVLLDRSIVVTRSEVDGWKAGYGILATGVVIFAALMMSGG